MPLSRKSYFTEKGKYHTPFHSRFKSHNLGLPLWVGPLKGSVPHVRDWPRTLATLPSLTRGVNPLSCTQEDLARLT